MSDFSPASEESSPEVSFRSVEVTGQGGERIAAAEVVETPEPSTILLLGAGLAGLIAIRRRRA